MNHTSSFDLQGHLDPQERLLWSGQPRQGVVLRVSDIFLIPFSLLWGGTAIYFEYLMIVDKEPIGFAIFGIPFVVIGVYMIVGRFYVEAKQREKTFYAITSERILIISGLLRKTVRSLDLRTLSDLSLTESSDGSGVIMFGQSLLGDLRFGGISWPGLDQMSGSRMEVLKDTRQVYQIIREAQKNASIQSAIES